MHKKTESQLTKVLVIRVSEQLYNQIHNVAIAAGKTISDVLRLKIVGIKIPNRTQLQILGQILQLKSELKRQGCLLKHSLNELKNSPENNTLVKKIKEAANGYENIYVALNKLLKSLEENNGNS